MESKKGCRVTLEKQLAVCYNVNNIDYRFIFGIERVNPRFIIDGSCTDPQY